MRQPILVLTLLATTFAPCINSQTQDSNRRDGNWWIGNEQVSKVDYMIGFLDGMELGHSFSYWQFTNKTDSSAALSKVASSYAEYIDKYLTHVTVGQIVDGLNDFYSDYRNRRITISDGVWLVLNGISGVPKDKLDQMIQNFRANAATN